MPDLIEEMINSSKTTTREQPLQDENGFYYYDHLPEGTRQAIREDLANGTFKEQTPYLVHGFHSNRFECYRVKESLPESALEFIDLCRIFVWDDL